MKATLKRVCLIIPVIAVAVFAQAADKEPKTIITGEQMEISGGGKILIFTGSAKVEKGFNKLTADKIIQDKKNNRVEAYGNVVFNTINQAKEPMWGTSDKGVYDIQNDSGELSGGRPELVYYAKTSTGPVILRAGDISFNEVKEELYARDNVEIISSSATAYAPAAIVFKKTKNIILTGPVPQPLVVFYDENGKPNKYRADKITFLEGGNRVKLEGNVNVAALMENNKNRPKIKHQKSK